MNKKEVLFGLIVSLFLIIFVVPFASSLPDGLERVAEDLGFLCKSENATVFNAPIPDYIFPGINNEVLATFIAAIVGTSFVFFLSYGIAWLLKKR